MDAFHENTDGHFGQMLREDFEKKFCSSAKVMRSEIFNLQASGKNLNEANVKYFSEPVSWKPRKRKSRKRLM